MTDRRGHASLVVVALAVVLGFAAVADAQRMYRTVDPQGNVRYSDRPPPAPAASERGGPDGQVDDVLTLSGLRRQLQRVPEGIQADLREQRAAAARPEAVDRMAEVFTRTFTAEALDARVRSVFVARFDPVQAEAYLVWLRGPLSRRLNQVEAEAESPAGQAELARYAQTLQKVPPPPDRAALMRRLADVSGAVDVSVEVVIGMARASAKVLDAMRPPERRLKAGQLEAQIRTARPKIYDQMRVNVVIGLLFTYRELSNEDVETYTRFYETAPARWFVATTRRGVMDVIAALTEEAMGEVARGVIIPPRR
jgi:hypothetical protein